MQKIKAKTSLNFSLSEIQNMHDEISLTNLKSAGLPATTIHTQMLIEATWRWPMALRQQIVDDPTCRSFLLQRIHAFSSAHDQHSVPARQASKLSRPKKAQERRQISNNPYRKMIFMLGNSHFLQ